MTYTKDSQMALTCRRCGRAVHHVTALLPRWLVCDECRKETE